MKRLIALLSLMLCLTFTGSLCPKIDLMKQIDKERVFSGEKYRPYLVDSVAYPDLGIICATYDLNENGKIDTGANFEITGIIYSGKSIGYITKNNAREIVINPNEDSRVDYSYRDTTGNGILDTKKREGIDNPGINI